VANAGGLGLIGGGSMDPDLFRLQIRKARSLVSGDGTFGVNVPIFYRHAPELLDVALDEGIRIFFMSGGSPTAHTPRLKAAGCTVVHVVAAAKHARKAAEAGCDAVVAEGFEAGGHNGLDETTTLVLVPQVVDAVSLPVIAAGGIADGRGMAAAFALGAAGVQIGSRLIRLLCGMNLITRAGWARASTIRKSGAQASAASSASADLAARL
jgi:enoyl-[acyl-carrier protein] reductase II